MKRFWLPSCLACLVLVMGGLGIYREAGLRLSHALERFRTALPAGAQFHYSQVKPALLLGGVTLHDVSFRYRDTEFHARRVRFGYPKLLSNGTLSLASLMLDAPSYANRTHQIIATRARFHHLLIPSSAETLHEGHDEADSMHSLAAIMSFEPEDITSLRFERMQLSDVHVTTIPPATGATSHAPPFTLEGFTAETLMVEGYGLGARVHALMDGLSLSLRLTDSTTSSLPALLRQILLPGQDGTAPQGDSPMGLHLALQHLEARQGHVQWLKPSFRHEGNPAAFFWQDPAATLWEKPGKLDMAGLTLIFDQQDRRRLLALARLTGERWEEKTGLHMEAELQGLTSRLSPPPSPFAAPVSLPTHYHINTTARQEGTSWQESFQLRTIFGRNSPTRLTATLTLPETNPLHLSDDSTARFLRDGQCLGTELITEGTDIFTYYDLLAPAQQATSSTQAENTAPATNTTPQAQNTGTQAAPSGTADPGNTAATPRLGNLSLHRPILTPVLDFIISPAGRSLILRTGPLSLEELAHIATDSSDEARFDRLHVLSVTAQEQ